MNTRAKGAYLSYDSMIAKIQSGELDAYDVCYCHTTKENYVISPELEPWAVRSKIYVFNSVEEANTNMQTLIDQLGFKAIDDYTFEVKLATPTPYFLSLMAFPAFYPVNEAFVNEVTEDKFGTSVDTFLYNGPFLFTEWKISKSLLVNVEWRIV